MMSMKKCLPKTKLRDHRQSLDIPTLNSWLRRAAKFGETENMRRLIKQGAEIDCRDKEGWTPLHFACIGGSVDAVRLLLEHGAEVNARTTYGQTPLHWASASGYDPIVMILLNRGAQINARGSDGWTPLHWACHHGRAGTALILLNKGADYKIENVDGNTALKLFMMSPRADTQERQVQQVFEFFRELAPEAYFSAFCTAKMSPG